MCPGVHREPGFAACHRRQAANEVPQSLRKGKAGRYHWTSRLSRASQVPSGCNWNISTLHRSG